MDLPDHYELKEQPATISYMARNRTGYRNQWCYRQTLVDKFAPVFPRALESGYVGVPASSNQHTVNGLYQTLRCVLAFLRDHGTDYYGKVRFRRLPDGVAVIRKGQPKPLLIQDAQGNNVYLHSPPPQDQGDTRK
jgi:hypothetical protein